MVIDHYINGYSRNNYFLYLYIYSSGIVYFIKWLPSIPFNLDMIKYIEYTPHSLSSN